MNERHLIRLLTILTIGTVLLACSNSETKDRQNNKDLEKNINERDEVSADSVSYFKIGESLEEFKSHFNIFSETTGSKLRITDFKTNSALDYDTFESSLNKTITIIGQLNKSDNSIHAINVTVTSYKDNVFAITDFMVVIGSLLEYTNPRLDRMQVLSDLKFANNFDPNNFPTNIVRNGIEYAMLGDYQELSFIVSDPND